MQYWNFSSERGWVVLERAPSGHPCPDCSGLLYRVPRRLIDRLFSFRSQRFQCSWQGCSWAGNLSAES